MIFSCLYFQMEFLEDLVLFVQEEKVVIFIMVGGFVGLDILCL